MIASESGQGVLASPHEVEVRRRSCEGVYEREINSSVMYASRNYVLRIFCIISAVFFAR